MSIEQNLEEVLKMVNVNNDQNQAIIQILHNEFNRITQLIIAEVSERTKKREKVLQTQIYKIREESDFSFRMIEAQARTISNLENKLVSLEDKLAENFNELCTEITTRMCIKILSHVLDEDINLEDIYAEETKDYNQN